VDKNINKEKLKMNKTTKVKTERIDAKKNMLKQGQTKGIKKKESNKVRTECKVKVTTEDNIGTKKSIVTNLQAAISILLPKGFDEKPEEMQFMIQVNGVISDAELLLAVGTSLRNLERKLGITFREILAEKIRRLQETREKEVKDRLEDRMNKIGMNFNSFEKELNKVFGE
jgi:hypothetical protein